MPLPQSGPSPSLLPRKLESPCSSSCAFSPGQRLLSVTVRFSPAGLLAHAALFDGRQVKTHGYLLSVSDRCLSLDAMGFGGGKFLISKPDADAIRAYYRETGSNYIVISGTFRARFTGALPGRAPCGEAGIETITVELEDSRDYPGSEWIR